MTPGRWLGAIAVAGAALAALSFVDAWIVHHRVLSGEGYRDVVTTVSAWGEVAVPVLTAGIVVAMLTAALAALRVADRGPQLPAGLMLIGSVVALGLVGATLVPVGQDGHASSIDLSPGWAAFAGAALAALMVVCAGAADRPEGGRFALLGGALIVLVAVAAGGRWAALQIRAGSNEAWSDGSYTREATDGLPDMTLTIDDGRYAIGDRWAGTWESSGWTVSIDGDPACPEARGTYHVHGHPEPLDEDLRFVKIVDICEDGARAQALEAGIWARDR